MNDRLVPLSVKERHRILFMEATPKEEIIDWGKAHLEAGLYHDALEYFDRAQSKENLLILVDCAVKEVDLVLLLNTFKALNEEPDKGNLLKLKENALKSGKSSVAQQAAIMLIPKGEER